MYSKNLFVSKMKLYGDTQRSLAEALGLNICSLNLRINGKYPWKQDEMIFIRERYHLTDEEFKLIFLTKNVTEGEQNEN